MPDNDNSLNTVNFSTFKDCIARRILHKVGPSESAAADEGDALDEFATYLAAESWPTVPPAAQNATYESKESVPDIDEITFEAISPSFTESLISYGILSDEDDAMKFLRVATDEYLTQACAPPPPWKSTRTSECEICYREVALTYHHLIPRSVHAKALKKGWHPESMLNSVAWLCRYATAFVKFRSLTVLNTGLAIQPFMELSPMRFLRNIITLSSCSLPEKTSRSGKNMLQSNVRGVLSLRRIKLEVGRHRIRMSTASNSYRV